MQETVKILGLRFFNGSLEESVEQTLRGGLVLAPSGPGLAQVDRYPVYFDALQSADILLVDSGYMANLWKTQTGQSISRISGLRYLKALLDSGRLPNAEQQLWVMPTAEESDTNRRYLKEIGISLPQENCYLAPHYPDMSTVEDPVLLDIIRERQPQLVVVNVAGGKQEILGAWLKKHLNYNPGIVCTGAAIAFLTGRQAAIPDWIDRAKLGWLHRILHNPKRFIPRYVAAHRLALLIKKYGSHAPRAEA